MKQNSPCSDDQIASLGNQKVQAVISIKMKSRSDTKPGKASKNLTTIKP